MAAISNSALANILAKYQAKFRPDPQTENMLYHSSEGATPARLSYEQYDEYVNEFEAFLVTSKRKLLLQAALIILLTIIFIGLAFYFLGFDKISNIMDNEKSETYLKFGFMLIWMLPLLYKFWQGYKLYQKPTKELTLLPEGVVIPLTKQEIMDRRYMGMSEGMIIGAGVISIIGIVVILIDGIPIAPTDSKYIALFCVVFVGSIYVWKRKARAHKADDEIHARQRPKLD